jgi:CubicO group peptidase (beta-lactamase class C family)
MKTALLICLSIILFLPFNSKTQALEQAEWLVLGPMPIPAEDAQALQVDECIAWLQTDQVPASIKGIEAGQAFPFGAARLLWKSFESDEEARVNLSELYGEEVDFAGAYAYLEWESSKAESVLLGFGSDDLARIWLNGELIHESKTPRALSLDEDLVEADLISGTNRILVKVVDLEYDWGFSLRKMNPQKLQDALWDYAASGNLDGMETALKYGAKADHEYAEGLQAWHAATYKGRKEAQDVLRLHLEEIPEAANPVTAINYWMNKNIEAGDPGIALLISKDGEVVFQKGYGMANLEKGEEINTKTLFRIGSITKQFTSTAVLKMIEKGRAGLHDPIKKYFPDFPKADEVTIYHLMTHTSGIHSYTNEIDFDERAEEYIAPEKLYEEITNYEYDFEPGTSWSYSNSGYFLLGLIAEKLYGTDLNTILQRNFFSTLGMSSTAIYDNANPPGHPEATGYSWIDGAYEKAMNWDMSWANGAGALYSTLGDLMLWNEGLFSGKVLQTSWLDSAHTSAVLSNGELAEAFGSGYGLGWVNSDFRGQKMIHHSGGLHGWNSNLLYLPDEKITAVALSNTLPAKQISSEMTTQILTEIFFPEIFEEQSSFAALEIDPEKLKDYEGSYEYPGGAVMIVRADGKQLFAKLTGQPEHELFYAGEEEFFWKVVEAHIVFDRSDEGEITGGTHHQGGGSFAVSKIEEQESIQLDKAILERYAGSYKLMGQDVEISVREDHLYLQMAGQPGLALYPKSELEFFMKEAMVEAEFVLADDGSVELMKVNQSGMSFDATRVVEEE